MKNKEAMNGLPIAITKVPVMFRLPAGGPAATEKGRIPARAAAMSRQPAGEPDRATAKEL